MKRMFILVTPGGMGRLTGYRLKFDPTDPNQGIFFINGKTTQVAVVGKNDPSELMFLVPASLKPGDYSVEIRSAIGTGPVHTGLLANVLGVS